MPPFQPLLHRQGQRLSPGRCAAQEVCRAREEPERHTAPTAGGQPLGPDGVFWAAHRRDGSETGREESGRPERFSRIAARTGALGRAIGRRPNAHPGVEVSPPGPARRAQRDRRGALTSGAATRAAARGQCCAARAPLSPLDPNWHTCPALELGVPQLATHMAITGRQTSSLFSTPFFSTRFEDGAPRVLGTPACRRPRSACRRPWAPAWRPPAAAITFRKSCP
jgi:hypothetical protein